MFAPKKKLVLLLPILLLAGLLLTGARGPANTGRWASAYGLMTAARTDACSVLLPDGSVVISGGISGRSVLGSAEIFGADGRFRAAAPMTDPRSEHACAVLPDGTMLVAGGRGNRGGILNSVEIYDPAANAWKPAPPMIAARAGATVTVLKDQRILVAGGDTSGAVSDSLEIYDPQTGRFSAANPTLSIPRRQHAAALLPDGRVLIAGGSDGTNALDTVDVFDPATGRVSSAGKLKSPRTGLTATALLDGRIALIGGSDGKNAVGYAELYNPKTGAFSADASRMAVPRQGHIALLVPHNNTVLIAGGSWGGDTPTQAELYVPWKHKFEPFGEMQSGRVGVAASPVGKTGRVLLAGGRTMQDTTATADTVSLPTITTDQADYPPGQTVIFTFSNWTPDVPIQVSMSEAPDDGDPPVSFTVSV